MKLPVQAGEHYNLHHFLKQNPSNNQLTGNGEVLFRIALILQTIRAIIGQAPKPSMTRDAKFLEQMLCLIVNNKSRLSTIQIHCRWATYDLSYSLVPISI